MFIVKMFKNVHASWLTPFSDSVSFDKENAEKGLIQRCTETVTWQKRFRSRPGNCTDAAF